MVEITIEKLIELTGDLKDNQPSTQKFRNFISSSDVSRADLKAWINECLEKTGPNFNRALQDIVNCIGERLGFQVQYGLYVGRGEAIAYDGKWTSPDAKIQLVVDTKKSEAYRIDADQIGGGVHPRVEQEACGKWRPSMACLLWERNSPARLLTLLEDQGTETQYE